MNAKLLLCSLKRMLRIRNVKNTGFSILPYVFCALLLLTSSCFWRFDRDGSHDGHDRDQHHEQERKNLRHERERQGMNSKQGDFIHNDGLEEYGQNNRNKTREQ